MKFIFANREQWYDIGWTFASTTTLTTTESSSTEATKMARIFSRCLFTCTDSTGATRRIGYIKSASAASTTVTYTVVTNTDLASWDKDFRITPQQKVDFYRAIATPRIPWEQVADASNSQGIWEADIDFDAYLLPVNSAVRTAAAWAWAACAWNVYANTTNLFTTAQDMTTSSTYNERRPNTNTILAGNTVSVRVTSSAWATNKASDLQVKLFIVPQWLYLWQA